MYFKRLMSFTLCTLMLLPVFAIPVSAAEEENESVSETYVQSSGATGYGTFEYTFDSSDVAVAKYNDNDPVTVIPYEFDNKKVTAIAEKAFLNNTDMKGIVIPNSIVSIDSSAFTGCINLKDVYYIGTKDQWDGINNRNSEIKNATVYYAELNDDGFIYTPENNGINIIKYVGKETSVTIPDKINDVKVTKITAGAFNECLNLENIKSANDKFISEDGILYNSETKSLISCPPAKKDIKIATDCKGISSKAFENQDSLKEINIPDNIIKISAKAFYNCAALETVDIPSTTITINNSAFDKCDALNSIVVSAENKSYKSVDGVLYNIGNLGTSLVRCPIGKSFVNILQECKVISANSFYGCCNIEKIDIPENVQEIGSGAFNGCSRLKEINFKTSKITDLNQQVFKDCTSLTSIDINDSVTTIGSNVFGGCINLQTVKMPAALTSIGDNAFKDCSSINSIVIPNTVTEIGSCSFNGCINLESIKYPDISKSELKKVGSRAFYNCGKLNSFDIPDSVTDINNFAFQRCTSLENIVLPANEELTTLNKAVFSGCEKLKAIIIPSNIKKIESYALSTGIYSDNESYLTINYIGAAEAWTKIKKNPFYAMGVNVDLRCLGDINGDNKTSAKDAMLIQRYSINLYHLDDKQLSAGDIDSNGTVTAADSILIQRYSIKMINNLSNTTK